MRKSRSISLLFMFLSLTSITNAQDPFIKQDSFILSNILNSLEIAFTNTPPPLPETPTIFDAVLSNDRELLAELIKKGEGVNTRDSLYRTPLMYANNNSIEIIELLIAKGAYLNTRDNSGNTVLMLASERGDTELIKALLNYSVLVNAENKIGVTALHLAIQNGYTDIVALLLEHSANLNQKMPNKLFPVFEAVKNGYTSIVALLLERGINPNSTVPTTKTSLLSIASAYGYLSTVQLLLQNGANPNLANNFGVTPIFLSVGKQHHDITKLLLKYGASTTVKTKEGIILQDIILPSDHISKKLLK